MSDPRTPRTSYADLDSPAQMAADCEAVRRAIESGPPSLHFADYPREVRKREVSIDAATARLAAALHLHLD